VRNCLIDYRNMKKKKDGRKKEGKKKETERKKEREMWKRHKIKSRLKFCVHLASPHACYMPCHEIYF